MMVGERDLVPGLGYDELAKAVRRLETDLRDLWAAETLRRARAVELTPFEQAVLNMNERLMALEARVAALSSGGSSDEP